jgi:hypothetical protein
MAIFYLLMCAKQKRFHEDDEQGSAQSTVCEIFSQKRKTPDTQVSGAVQYRGAQRVLPEKTTRDNLSLNFGSTLKNI